MKEKETLQAEESSTARPPTSAHDDLLFLTGSLALEETGCGVSFDHEVVVKELLNQCRPGKKAQCQQS